MSRLKPCPKCGCPDELELDSSCAAEASWIECGWCEHRMQRRCDEETLAVKWNALGRKKMPEFDLEEEMAKLDKAPSQPRCEQCARLRKTGWFWYWEAKKAQRALAQQPAPVAPVGVDAAALLDSLEDAADDGAGGGLIWQGFGVNRDEKLAVVRQALAQQAAIVDGVDWKGLYRFNISMGYLYADPALTTEQADEMADADIAATILTRRERNDR